MTFNIRSIRTTIFKFIIIIVISIMIGFFLFVHFFEFLKYSKIFAKKKKKLKIYFWFQKWTKKKNEKISHSKESKKNQKKKNEKILEKAKFDLNRREMTLICRVFLLPSCKKTKKKQGISFDNLEKFNIKNYFDVMKNEFQMFGLVLWLTNLIEAILR